MHLSADDIGGEFYSPLFLFLALRTLLVLSLGASLIHCFGFSLSLSLYPCFLLYLMEPYVFSVFWFVCFSYIIIYSMCFSLCFTYCFFGSNILYSCLWFDIVDGYCS